MNLISLNKRIIGLTGSIASGKSVVAEYLAEKYGLPVYDADIFAREAVQIGSPILGNIANRYPNILLPNGSLNRPQLAEIIFNNSQERRWVDSQIHPYVRQQLEKALVEDEHRILVFVVPLLFEAQFTDLVTEIWVVYCDEATHIKRLMKRNNLTELEAKTRIASQMPLESKCQQADVVLDNSTTLENLYRQIDDLKII